MDRSIVRAVVIAAATIALVIASSLPASATTWDVFAAGTEYCADTYPGHGKAVDINFVGDGGAPLYAPNDGWVRIVSRWDGLPPAQTQTRLGNAVRWVSKNKREKLVLAHLATFGPTERGAVEGGALLGTLGDTGHAFGTHLHIERYVDGRPARVVLSGIRLDPWMDDDTKPYGRSPPDCNNGVVYESVGPKP